MSRMRSLIGTSWKIAMISGLLVLSVTRATATITAHYETDPALCPAEDVQFPGQKCPSGLQICGVNGSNIPQCYDNADIVAPIATATSNTQYTESIGGGYIIDCFTTPLDSAAPYCDVNGAWLCNRDDSCYDAPVNKATTCTGAGTYSCGACRSGYQDCDAAATTCEVQTSVTDYPTGAHNNYGASCAAQCDTSYLDCDTLGAGVGNGCEILNGGTCDTHAVYSGCSGVAGNCQCSSGYFDCNADLGTGGNGCEVHTGDSCTTGGVSGTYSGCTCIPTKSNFETGTESTYGSGDPLLWGTQLGTGSLMSFSNAVREVFSVGNSGAVVTSGGLTASGAIKTESGMVLNKDNAAQDAVLVFGNALGQQTLKFLNNTQRFEFSKELHVAGNLSASGSLSIQQQATFQSTVSVGGNLTVSGLINGVDITAITSSVDNSHLKVSSGAGLTIDVARGDYRLGGVVTQYGGVNDQAVTNNATNYVYFSSGGLTINTTGFPTDSAVIPLATVVTSGGSVNSVTDRRVFNTNNSQRTIAKIYEPQYEGAAFQGDGTNNVGQLMLSHSGGVLRNYYQWTSTRSTLQDYAIILRVPVSADFVRWGGTPLSLVYRVTVSETASNALSFQVFDTAGAAVTLTGSGTTNIGGTDWTTATWGFAGTPTWTAGGEMLLKITLAAKDNAAVQVGPLTVRYTDMLSE